MINVNYKKIAQWAMDFALKNGCQSCRVSIHTSKDSNFSYRDLLLEQLQQSSGNSMRLEFFVDGKYGQFSTNKIQKSDLEGFIKQNISATRFLEKDECHILPDISVCFQEKNGDLMLYDHDLESIKTEQKLDLALDNVKEIYHSDDRIISINAGYSDGDSNVYIIQNNGFEGENCSTWFSIHAGVSMKGTGESRPSEGWWNNALFFDVLPKKGYGHQAYKRCVQKLEQKKIASGNYPMIVDYLSSARLLTPLLSALYGSSLQQRNSFLLDKLGETVGSKLLTLTDNPHLTKTHGARYFDYEGVATKKRPIFEAGILRNYFIDTYYSKKMNIQQTISSPSTLTLQQGEKSLEQLIQSQKKAILVTGFNGGNQNSSTGDYSYGIEGFLIENGEITQSLSEMNITGNLIELWKNLIETGNDPNMNSSYQIPSLLFSSVNFSGL